MMHVFHKYTSTPLAVVALAYPMPTAGQIDFWLSVALKVGAGILLAVQIRYWWRKDKGKKDA